MGRTDVMLLARVEPFAGRARLLTLPRDLYVQIPGVGPGRLNEAYYRGALGSRTGDDPREGMSLLRSTLRNALGLRIRGSIVIDFAGFAGLVDALGGIEVVVPQRIDDEFVGEDGTLFSAHFAAGPQRLDGLQALTYARTRKGDGDRFRRQRHLDLVAAILRGVSGLRSASQVVRVARAAAGAIHTDLGVVRLGVIGQALLRARATRQMQQIHVAPPIVRSERIERGWVHLDRGNLKAFVRDRFVIR